MNENTYKHGIPRYQPPAFPTFLQDVWKRAIDNVPSRHETKESLNKQSRKIPLELRTNTDEIPVWKTASDYIGSIEGKDKAKNV